MESGTELILSGPAMIIYTASRNIELQVARGPALAAVTMLPARTGR